MQTTTNYKEFKTLEGNREVDMAHIKRLAETMSLYPELAKAIPVLVNEKMEVIDGQHRIEALKLLERPITYLVIEGADLGSVHTLNTVVKRWTPRDYAESYAKLGKKEYQLYLEADDAFPLIKHSILLEYLSLGGSHGSSTKDREPGISILFKTGRLSLPDYSQSMKLLKQLTEIGKVVPINNHMAHALFDIMRHDDYDHLRMMHKLNFSGEKVGRWGSENEYKHAFEIVYNDYAHTDDRVRLW